MIRLDEHERIALVARKHWVVFLRDTIGLAALYAAPFLIYRFAAERPFALSPEETVTLSLSAALIAFSAIAWSLLIWVKFFGIWTDYYLDAWLVTDKRIVNIEQIGFFRREISTLRLERVQDVTIEVHGIIPTFFNFGDIRVQTAAAQREFVMRGIPRPGRVKEIILERLAALNGSGI